MWRRKMNEIEFKELLKKRANKINVTLDEKQLEMFFAYKELILEWNKKINLTAIKEDDEFINKHFIDSLTITKYITDKENKMIDIGTGAGFPGIPVNIFKNNNVTLFDSLNKRLKVLNNIIEELNLRNINTLHGRAEETFKNETYREKYNIATSRAVANLNVLAEYMLPALKVGGICICMKSGNIQEELEEAQKAIKILGGKIEKIEKITLPDTDIKRNIVIIRKERKTPFKYPRKPGTPSKDPIR